MSTEEHPVSTWRGKKFSDMTDDEIREMCAPRAEHPMSDEPTPEARDLLANIARGQIRKALRQAHDAATLLAEITRQSAEQRLGTDDQSVVRDPEYDKVLEFWAAIGHVMAKADEQLKDR